MRADLRYLFGMTGFRAHIHSHDTPLVGTVRNLWELLKSRPELGCAIVAPSSSSPVSVWKRGGSLRASQLILAEDQSRTSLAKFKTIQIVQHKRKSLYMCYYLLCLLLYFVLCTQSLPHAMHCLGLWYMIVHSYLLRRSPRTLFCSPQPLLRHGIQTERIGQRLRDHDAARRGGACGGDG